MITFILSFVSQHGSVNAITNGVNIRYDGLEPCVYGNSTSVVPLNTHFFQTKVIGIRPSANTDEKYIGFNLFSFAIFGRERQEKTFYFFNVAMR